MEKVVLPQEGSFISFHCEMCDGMGEEERNIDGADVPCLCTFCNGTGIEKFDRAYIEKIFEQRNQYSNEMGILKTALRLLVERAETSDIRFSQEFIHAQQTLSNL